MLQKYIKNKRKKNIVINSKKHATPFNTGVLAGREGLFCGCFFFGFEVGFWCVCWFFFGCFSGCFFGFFVRFLGLFGLLLLLLGGCAVLWLVLAYF
jgi:hypothetical protein